MDEGLPESVPFLPDRIIEHQNGVLITGMLGEFLWLNNDLIATASFSIPHPMRLRQGVVVDGHVIGTWLDRELMLACMGSIPVGTAENGDRRSDLRTAMGTSERHYPAGNQWAHALDAEPMAMATDGETVVFDLYHRGLYGIGANAEELWRMAPAEWSYPKKRPRNEETIALHIYDEECWLTSKGGRVQRRSVETGHLIEEHLLNHVEAPLEHHFKQNEQDLLCSTSGLVTWLEDMTLVAQLQLSGPVHSASWDERLQGWRVAGWREEIVISKDVVDRRPTKELPVHILPKGSGALVLFNDGSWENTAFEYGQRLD